MKANFIAVFIFLLVLSCKKENVKPSDTKIPQGFSALGGMPSNMKANQIFGLISSKNGVIYSCVSYSLSGNEFTHFFRMDNSNSKWQQLGDLEPSSNVYSLSLDNWGSFYFADSRAHKFANGNWNVIDAINHDPTQGSSSIGIHIAVSPGGKIYGDFERDTIGYYRYQFSMWDGIKWNWIGAPVDDNISSFYPRSMICGSNEILYVGSFIDNPKHRVYKYDGANSWSQLGSSDFQLLTYTTGLVIDKDNNLYTTGYKTVSYTDSIRGDFIAKWNGTAWTTIDYPNILGPNTATNNFIYTITVDSKGNLYAAGTLVNDKGEYIIAKWNGITWTELGADREPLKANGAIYYLSSDDQGRIYAAGDFTDSTGNAYIARYQP